MCWGCGGRRAEGEGGKGVLCMACLDMPEDRTHRRDAHKTCMSIAVTATGQSETLDNSDDDNQHQILHF